MVVVGEPSRLYKSSPTKEAIVLIPYFRPSIRVIVLRQHTPLGE